MKNNNYILENSQKFVYSLFLVSSTLTIGGVQEPEQPPVQQQKSVLETIVSATAQEFESLSILRDRRADRIDAYFAQYNTPLAGQGKNFVESADKNNIDWRLLPAIAMLESTGGKYEAEKFNPFGWDCATICKYGFPDYAEAIETVARNLGGNNPNTAKYYANKSVKAILETYNPPSVRPDYVSIVSSVMRRIDTIGIPDSVNVINLNF